MNEFTIKYNPVIKKISPYFYSNVYFFSESTIFFSKMLRLIVFEYNTYIYDHDWQF